LARVPDLVAAKPEHGPRPGRPAGRGRARAAALCLSIAAVAGVAWFLVRRAPESNAPGSAQLVASAVPGSIAAPGGATAGPAPAPSVEVPAKPAAPRIGYLTIDTTPWTSVYLGSRKLGDTPLIHVVVPAGRLKLLLRNDEAGVKQLVEVEVAPGKTASTRLQF
jgi:hypothetical protein